MDCEACPAVERNPGEDRWGPGITGTRVPLHAPFREPRQRRKTVDEFIGWFPGVDKQQVRAVLEHEARRLRAALAR